MAACSVPRSYRDRKKPWLLALRVQPFGRAHLFLAEWQFWPGVARGLIAELALGDLLATAIDVVVDVVEAVEEAVAVAVAAGGVVGVGCGGVGVGDADDVVGVLDAAEVAAVDAGGVTDAVGVGVGVAAAAAADVGDVGGADDVRREQGALGVPDALDVADVAGEVEVEVAVEVEVEVAADADAAAGA